MRCMCDNNNDLLTLHDLLLECVENGLKNEFFEVIRINKASYERVKRLRERIKSMLLKGPCLFLTLTFNDDTLSNTTDKQRRVAVVRYLKQFNCDYVANIDFGSKNHREHYHAVICSKSIDMSSWRKYGNINIERVRNRKIECDGERLSKYVAKLSNHCIKETTKRCSLIYSR